MVKAIYQDLSLELEKYIRNKNISGRMPGVLRLSRELKVHHVTLSKAIKILERKGMLKVKGTKGTFVVDDNEHSKTNIIGIVGINSKLYCNDSLLDILNNYVNPKGYNVIGINFQENLFRNNKRILLNFPVDGFVFRMSSLLKEQLEILRNENMPIVTCNYVKEYSWLNMCGFDYRQGYRMMLDRLVSMGHSRIAFVDFKRCYEYHYFISDIKNIFQEVLKNNFRKKFFYTSITAHDAFQRFGENYIEVYARLALKYILNNEELPTVIVGPDSLIHTIRQELKNLKIQVPKDISLCCSSYTERRQYDNLCGIRHSENKLLKWALDNVIEQIEKRQNAVQTYLQEALWDNGSSCSDYCARAGPVK